MSWDKKRERILAIVNLLKEHKTMSVNALSDALHVSDMTIRRDISLLQNNGLLERSYGIAKYIDNKEVLIDGNQYYDISLEKIKNFDKKEKIGIYAAKLINPQDFILIDSGTTTYRMVRHIDQSMPFRALCYNFSILSELQCNQNVDILFAGGYYHKEDQMFTSKENTDFIRHVRANKTFISASGFHDKLGITCIHPHEVDNKQAIIASSACTILLMDSTKFGLVKPSFFAPLSAINILVTDSGITDEWKNIAQNFGIDVRIV